MLLKETGRNEKLKLFQLKKDEIWLDLHVKARAAVSLAFLLL